MLLAPRTPPLRTDWVHLFLAPRSVTLHRWDEMGHQGTVYTMDIDKCCKLDFFFLRASC